MSETFSLPPRERAKRYRIQASEIRAKAERYPREIRASFFRIAEYWEQLAAEAEARDERHAAAAVQKTRPPDPPALMASELAAETADPSRNKGNAAQP